MLALGSFFVMPLQAVISVVYNLRIAETTKRQAFDKNGTHYMSLGVATPFNIYRKKYNGDMHDAGGVLGTLIYAPEKYFLRVDTAVAQVQQKAPNNCFATVQADDILFTGGYTKTINKQARVTISGLLGIPTHKDKSLEHVQFGYAHVGLGGQIDGSVDYLANNKHFILGALRMIHFFPRTTCAIVNNCPKKFTFTNGTTNDFLIAHRSRLGNHRCEIGYDASMLWGTKIHPSLDATIQKTEYIRSSFYGTYKYHFVIKKLPQAITAAFSYGFDHRPKLYGNKRIITAWASWGVNF